MIDEMIDEMIDVLQSLLGNPSAAAHGYGQAAARGVASCRERIAEAFGGEQEYGLRPGLLMGAIVE